MCHQLTPVVTTPLHFFVTRMYPHGHYRLAHCLSLKSVLTYRFPLHPFFFPPYNLRVEDPRPFDYRLPYCLEFMQEVPFAL